MVLSRRPAPHIILMLAAACADREPASDETAATAASSSSTATTGTGTPTSTTDEPTSGTGATPACGDGVRTPGELCFHEPIVRGIGISSLSLDAADVDRDGFEDLLVGGLDDAWVILHGDGESLDLGPTTPCDGAVYAIQAADLDGEGSLEVAVLRQTIMPMFVDVVTIVEDTVTVETTIQLAGPALDLEFADLDQDSKLDLIHGGYIAGSVVALRGEGDGGFAPWKEIAVGRLPRGIAVADLDGDGEPEIAAALESCHGGFQDPEAHCDPSETALVRGLAGSPTLTILPTGPLYNDDVLFADLELDGALDLIAIAGNCGFQGIEWVCAEQSHLAVFCNAGAGKFGAAELLAVGRVPTAGLAADLDGDGFPELAIAHLGPDDSPPTGRISLFPNVGDGSFAADELRRGLPLPRDGRSRDQRRRRARSRGSRSRWPEPGVPALEPLTHSF